ncbi:hypothetical protein LCGC14_1577830 [marine sediment metagenome]|uniref:Uncharacterized protein n=1 Tax=marine sediment metagenome TaxID=412755 RepID=A0A0F9IHW4_9ZZZZ
MQRRHKSQFYSSEGMRQLQAQIDELWGVVDRRVEDVEAAVEELRPESYASPHLRPATTFVGANVRVRWDSEKGEVVTEPMPDKTSAPGYDPAEQAAADASVNEIIDIRPALNPQPFKVNHCGRGWYQVADSEGKPIDVRKMRKEPAEAACRVAMEGA